MGNNLHDIRKAKKLTLRQLSDLTNLSVGYLCHLEKGTRTNPSMNTMTTICNALNISISDMFYI